MPIISSDLEDSFFNWRGTFEVPKPTHRIRITFSRPDNWYKDGEEYEVKKFKFQGTDMGVAACNCDECLEERKGLPLYDLWEVVGYEHNGSVVAVHDAEVLTTL